ncbi:MAG: FAD-dependent urate hydroxylase HpxO [Bacteroidia bacterium]
MRIAKDDPILIIGAGPAGLLTAVALRQHGFSRIRVLDQSPGSAWAAGIAQVPAWLWTGTETEGLAAFLREAGRPWQHFEVRTMQGQVLHEKSLAGLPLTPLGLDMTTLYDWVQTQLGDTEIVGGREFISFTQDERKVQAHFTDGYSESAALLIGADGLRSRVRLQMQGNNELRLFDLATWWARCDTSLLTGDLADLATSPYAEYWGQGIRGAVVTAGNGQAGLSLTTPVPAQHPVPTDEAAAWLAQTFADTPFTDAIAGLEPSAWQMAQHADLPPFRGWSDGRVVLAGMAAFPHVPLFDMSSGLLLRGAFALARHLDAHRKRLDRAFAAYEKEIRRPAALFNRVARSYAGHYAQRQGLSYRLRNAVFSGLPGSLTVDPWYQIIEGQK